ncbi:hypothetical protein KA005_29215 [bacterium]|nr:hypothetical protein [bacterium]
MRIREYIIFSIPTILVTLFFGFIPWGLVTAIVTPIGFLLIAVLFPTKRYIRTNMKTALEGLSYGRLNDAKDHMTIAIREAESTNKIERSEVYDLLEACDKVTKALEDAGQREMADSLRERCSKLASRFANYDN